MEKLKKTATVINTFLKIGAVFVICTGLVGAAFSVFALVTQPEQGVPVNVISTGGMQFSLAKDMLVDSTGVMIATLVGSLLTSAAWLFTIYQLRCIFKPMSTGVAFPKGMSRRVRNIAFAQLALGVFSVGTNMVMSSAMYESFGMAELFLNENIASCRLMVDMNSNFIWVFGLLLLLSEIFHYGEQLQQQSDETL